MPSPVQHVCEETYRGTPSVVSRISIDAGQFIAIDGTGGRRIESVLLLVSTHTPSQVTQDELSTAF